MRALETSSLRQNPHPTLSLGKGEAIGLQPDDVLSPLPLPRGEDRGEGFSLKVISPPRKPRAFCVSAPDSVRSSRIKGDALRRTSPRASRALSLPEQDSTQ